MPHRFQFLEKIAFSMVVMSAVFCSSFIAYERCPDVQVALSAGKEVLRYSGEYGFACASPYVDACAQFPSE
jgi:hypothetical protein